MLLSMDTLQFWLQRLRRVLSTRYLVPLVAIFDEVLANGKRWGFCSYALTVSR